MTFNCGATSDSHPNGSSQSAPANVQDHAVLLEKINNLGRSYAKKSWAFIKPTSVKHALLEAFIANNIIRFTPTAFRWGKGILTHETSLQILSIPFSTALTALLTKYSSDLVTPETKDKNVKQAIYGGIFNGTFMLVHGLIQKIILPNQTIQKTENEQLKVAIAEVEKAEKILKPTNGNYKAEFETIKKLSPEKEISDFIDALIEFDPSNLTKTPTPVSYWYGRPSSGKTERMTQIAQAARKIGYEVHILDNLSRMEDQTYVGIDGKLLEYYYNKLADERDAGKKILLLFDEAFAKSQNNTNQHNTGNQNPHITTLIDKFAYKGIPLICASNTSKDELDQTITERFSTGKTYLKGSTIETTYPSSEYISRHFELFVKKEKVLWPSYAKTGKFIAKWLDKSNYGIIYNAFTKIAQEHAHRKIILDIDKPVSKKIVIRALADTLENNIKTVKDTITYLNNNQRLADDRKKARINSFKDLESTYETAYKSFAKEHTNILIEQVFTTEDSWQKILDRLATLNTTVNEKMEENIDEKNEKIETKEKEKENNEKLKNENNMKLFKNENEKNKIENKNEKEKNEKIEKNEKNKIENEKEKENEHKNDIKNIIENIKAAYKKTNITKLIKLFNEHVKTEINADDSYDPDRVQEARNIVTCAEGAKLKGYNFANDEYRMKKILEIAKKLKKGEEITLPDSFGYELRRNASKGAKLLKSTVSTTGGVIRSLSDYTYIGTWLPMLSTAYDTVASSIGGTSEKHPQLDITRYKSYLEIFAQTNQCAEPQALARLLSNVVENSEDPDLTFRKTVKVLTKAKDEKENKIKTGKNKLSGQPYIKIPNKKHNIFEYADSLRKTNGGALDGSLLNNTLFNVSNT